MTTQNRCLILFSDNYPFSVGEEFLEQEIEYWADDFKKIIIIPLRSRADETITRGIRSNMELLPLPRIGKDDWRLWALKRLPKILFGSPQMVENSPIKNRVRWAVDVRFASMVHEMYARVSEVLTGIDFKEFDSVTIYSYWFFTGVGVGELLKQKQLKGIPTKIVARAHAYDVDEADSPRGYIGSRSFLLDSVDEVYPISEYAAGFLMERRPDLAKKITVRRLGVPAAQPRKRKRSEPLWVVSCSHMADYKRVDLIVDAIGELQKRGVSVRWTHIGESDPSRVAAMNSKVESVVPNPAMVELVGHMRNNEVREQYAKNDFALFLNCSSGEGVPVAVMEAQAAGLPVIATAAGGTGEIVHDGWNGILLPIAVSGSEIADAIESIEQLPAEDYDRLASNAVAGWRDRSDADAQYQAFRNEVLNS